MPSVDEAYAEVSVPLLKDQPGVKRLDLDISGRQIVDHAWRNDARAARLSLDPSHSGGGPRLPGWWLAARNASFTGYAGTREGSSLVVSTIAVDECVEVGSLASYRLG